MTSFKSCSTTLVTFALLLGSMKFRFGTACLPRFGLMESTPRFNLLPNWMIALSDDLPLSQITLPGTHNTMARYGGIIARTQEEELDKQLLYGIRVIDIRCRHYSNKCLIYHGIMYQYTNLDDVLTIVVEFLSSNPSEVVIIRLKEESTAYDVSQTLAHTIYLYLSNPKYSPYIYREGNYNPQLRTVRGKIVILDQLSGGFGIPWNLLSNCIQDNYNIPSIFHMNIKWNSIIKQFDLANAQTKHGFCINFLSGTQGCAPQCFSIKINTWFVDYFRVNVIKYKNLGIIMMDFPSSEQISQIIDINYQDKAVFAAFYEHHKYLGEKKIFSVKSHSFRLSLTGNIGASCLNFVHWDKRVSSVYPLSKCIAIWDELNCSGSFLNVYKSPYDPCRSALRECKWNDRARSISAC